MSPNDPSRVRDLFAKALELDPAKRQAFLDDVREGRFPSALHLGILALALLRGLLDDPCA